MSYDSVSTRRSIARSPSIAYETEPPSYGRANLVRWGVRRLWYVALASLLLLLVYLFRSEALAGENGGIARNMRSTLSCLNRPTVDTPTIEPFDKSLVLNFVEPQDSFRVQLKHEARYITTLSYGGHANQFISIYNLLYLGKLLNRVTIIPTLMPLHFDADPVPMSTFFDLDRFWRETQQPYVELQDVKYLNWTIPPPRERLGCWSVHQRVTPGGGNVNDGAFPSHGIKVEFWGLPEMRAGSEGWNIWYNELLAFDLDKQAQKDWIQTCKDELIPQMRLKEDDMRVVEEMTRQELYDNLWDRFDPINNEPPDDQIMCLDTTLFIGSNLPPRSYPPRVVYAKPRSYEGEGWIHAGQYLHFTPEVEALADYYITEMFNVTSMAQVPPLITVHVRRADFAEARGLTSLDKYTDGVARVRKTLQSRIDDPDSWEGAGKDKAQYFPGVSADDYAVVATSDEDHGSPFVQELLALGWKVLDHERMQTSKKYNEWYPTILDQAILARGRGFVGTEWSTYSTMSGLRAKYWNGAVEEWTPSLL